MRLRLLLLLLLGGVAAGSGMVLLRNLLDAPPPEPLPVAEPIVIEKPAPLVEILVAASNVAAGTRLNQEHFAWASWPEAAVTPGQVVRGRDDETGLYGQLARRYIAAGEPVTEVLLAKPGTGGFLSAILTPGMRAVSIAVTVETGNAGFVFPGDYVDLLLSQRIVDRARDLEINTAERVLERVRVLAVDQQMAAPDSARVAQTFTLEVSPDQATVIAVARRMGELSVSLRPVEEQPGEGLAAYAYRDWDVSPALRQFLGDDRQSALVILRGDQETVKRLRAPAEEPAAAPQPLAQGAGKDPGR